MALQILLHGMGDDEELVIRNYRLLKVKKGSFERPRGRGAQLRPTLYACNSLLTAGPTERPSSKQDGADGNWDEVAQISLATVDQETFMATLDAREEGHEEVSPPKDSLCLLNDDSLALEPSVGIQKEDGLGVALRDEQAQLQE